MSEYMYDTEEDPGHYPGTSVLINLLDIRDQAELGAFESEIVSARGEEPLPEGNFDLAHYRAIHRHLFGDVYAWAGTPRTIRTGKGGNWFCYPENIDAQLRDLFRGLARNDYLRGRSAEAFAEGAAAFLAYLNAIHPFREGNGRAQLAFMALLSEQAGYHLAYEGMDPTAMLQAMIRSFSGDEEPLAAIIKSIAHAI
jgi:cell filamentation protein